MIRGPLELFPEVSFTFGDYIVSIVNFIQDDAGIVDNWLKYK